MRLNWQKVYLGIGSNLGDRRLNIKKAVSLLKACPDITDLVVSSLHETDPVGPIKQKKFLNAVLKIRTCLNPEDLLKYLQSVEKKTGRKKSVKKWGPRIIDLDILFFGNLVLRKNNLNVPHPLMHMREFVLKPMAEISAYKVHPVYRKTIKTLLNNLRNEDHKKHN